MVGYLEESLLVGAAESCVRWFADAFERFRKSW